IQRPLADPRGSAGRIGVRAFPDRCVWTAGADVPWVTMGSSGGAGVKGVTYTIAANGTGAVRTGHILIGGQTLTVTQAAGVHPVVIIDTPPNGSTVAQPYRVAGWAIDRCALSGTGMVGP